jgi:hypothetical protein
MEDIDTIATGISESLADLLSAAEAVQDTQAGMAARADLPG